MFQRAKSFILPRKRDPVVELPESTHLRRINPIDKSALQQIKQNVGRKYTSNIDIVCLRQKPEGEAENRAQTVAVVNEKYGGSLKAIPRQTWHDFVQEHRLREEVRAEEKELMAAEKEGKKKLSFFQRSKSFMLRRKRETETSDEWIKKRDKKNSKRASFVFLQPKQ